MSNQKNVFLPPLRKWKSEEVLPTEFVSLSSLSKSVSNLSWILPQRLISSSHFLKPAPAYTRYLHLIALRCLFCQADYDYSLQIHTHMKTLENCKSLWNDLDVNIVIEHAKAQEKVDEMLSKLMPKLDSVVGEFLIANNILESIQNYDKFVKLANSSIQQVSSDPLQTEIDINKILMILLSHTITTEDIKRNTTNFPLMIKHLVYEGKRFRNLVCLVISKQTVLAKLLKDPASIKVTDVPYGLPKLCDIEDEAAAFSADDSEPEDYVDSYQYGDDEV
ncbi:hypothetical protein PPYR_08122 [Photinus pyralis]|uniref:Uncharacterized protein n=1 Tax=Photinus pyralis TaxID=7054 RepID=A0A1Y1K1W9_PHOPY|nr:hypothetical protein PPYR_08122 [Photinus pyralis]